MPFIIMVPIINAADNLYCHLTGKKQVSKCEESALARQSTLSKVPKGDEIEAVVRKRQTTRKIVPTMGAGSHIGGMETIRYNRPENEGKIEKGVYDEWDTDNQKHMRSMKAERLSSKHLSSDCTVERELMQACVKDRYYKGGEGYKGMTCTDVLAKYRQCIRKEPEL